MKLKNTLGLAIGSLIAATSIGALAQGQGAVEIEGFAKKEYYDSDRNFKNDGNLFGGSVGYFLTDDVELRLGLRRSSQRTFRLWPEHQRRGHRPGCSGTTSTTQATCCVRMFRPVSPTRASTRTVRTVVTVPPLANVGGGAKLYFTDNFYARAGVEAQYNIDQGNTEWAPSVGIGVNFGGGSKPAPAPVPAPEVCSDSDNDGVCDNVDKCPDTPANVTVDADGCPAVAEVVRVELDVKFDFDKSVVKPNSYGDIKNLADFMKQYPSTSTTVGGHTDSRSVLTLTTRNCLSVVQTPLSRSSDQPVRCLNRPVLGLLAV